MKFIKIFFCCIGLFFLSNVYSAQSVILYGDEAYPPYSFIKNGEFVGMYVDILTKAAEKLKPSYIVKLSPVPWKRGLADLESGRSFGLFPPGLKKERTYITTYSVKIYQETVVLFCNSNIMKTPHKIFPDDFLGLTIGVNDGFLLSEKLMDAVKKNKIKLESAYGNESNIRKLSLNRIDCYASDRGAALYTAKNIGIKLQEAVALTSENTFIGFSSKDNPPYKADFIQKMNAALEELKKNGEISKIESIYFK